MVMGKALQWRETHNYKSKVIKMPDSWEEGVQKQKQVYLRQRTGDPLWSIQIEKTFNKGNIMKMYHIFCINSLVEGHLVSFQILIVINKAIVNIVEYVSSLHVKASFRYMSRSGISGSSVSSMPNFCHVGGMSWVVSFNYLLGLPLSLTPTAIIWSQLPKSTSFGCRITNEVWINRKLASDVVPHLSTWMSWEDFAIMSNDDVSTGYRHGNFKKIEPELWACNN